jgi:hypothetical protein
VAIECFNKIASHIDVDWAKAKMATLSADASWADPKAVPPFNTAACLAMSDFLVYSWFGRLRVYQEIRSAAEGAVLLCGYQSVGWTGFRKAVCFLDQKFQLMEIPPDYYPEIRERVSNAMLLCQYEY